MSERMCSNITRAASDWLLVEHNNCLIGQSCYACVATLITFKRYHSIINSLFLFDPLLDRKKYLSIKSCTTLFHIIQ